MREKTKPIVVRIPIELANKIDQLVERDGQYSNKPDFIVASARSLLERMAYFCFWFDTKGLAVMFSTDGGDPHTVSFDKTIDKLKERIRDGSKVYRSTNDVLSRYVVEYKKYKGEMKPISIYLPEGLIERISVINEDLEYRYSMLDFLRISIIHGIIEYEYFEDMFTAMIEDAEDIMKTIKEEIKAIEKSEEKEKRMKTIP